MNQDAVKELLLSVEESSLEFSVTFTGKASRKVNGLYKPDTHEILLHNRNFKTDNQLIYTAIHEYTHHLLNETSGGFATSRVHNTEFWARFHGLLEKAEEKGLYSISVEQSPELAELTAKIRTEYLEKNGRLMQEFGRLLAQAHQLCLAADIRFEDYIDRVLRLPRTAAKSAMKVGSSDINPAIGYDNMKIVASLSGAEKRGAAERQIMAGHSPDTVRAIMSGKMQEQDLKTKLEKEKRRLE